MHSHHRLERVGRPLQPRLQASLQPPRLSVRPSRLQGFLKSTHSRPSGAATRTDAIRRRPMADTLIKSTTRHVRLFTARVENGQLIADSSQLTLDLDPDNEFLWEPASEQTVQQRFRELVEAHAGADLTDYTLRRIGSELEGTIRQLLQAGQLRYNPDCRVLNYSMGLPQSPASA